MHNSPLVILSSARKNGDTHQLVSNLFLGKDVALLDLLDYHVTPYSYKGEYPSHDQFLTILMDILKHDSIVFATPVYWYAMSGSLKNFFDRLTDLVTINKTIGRQMKGKTIYLLAVGAENVLPSGFEVPFAQTSTYFDMEYKGCYYCRTDELLTMPDKESFLYKIYTSGK